jgi:hypothetical protein
MEQVGPRAYIVYCQTRTVLDRRPYLQCNSAEIPRYSSSLDCFGIFCIRSCNLQNSSYYLENRGFLTNKRIRIRRFWFSLSRFKSWPGSSR